MNKPKYRGIRSQRSADISSSKGSSRGVSNAKQRYEHYLALAREKALSGDRIEAENYYQHAEHYFRSAVALAPSSPKADQ